MHIFEMCDPFTNSIFLLQLLSSHIGHVQISQVPLRDNPIDEGELNHDFILKKLAPHYNDFIGLEYFSKSSSFKSFLFSLCGVFSFQTTALIILSG